MAAPLTAQLKKQNFENMVWFYQDELRAVVNGQPISELFNQDQKRALRYLNILGARIPKFKRKGIWKGKTQINMVTKKARALLDLALIVLCVLALP